jgi:hypothetical protein
MIEVCSSFISIWTRLKRTCVKYYCSTQQKNSFFTNKKKIYIVWDINVNYSRTEREKYEERVYMKTQHVLFTNAIDSLHSSWINCFFFIVNCFFFYLWKMKFFLLSSTVLLNTRSFQPCPYGYKAWTYLYHW